MVVAGPGPCPLCRIHHFPLICRHQDAGRWCCALVCWMEPPLDSAQISTFHYCWWELVNGEGYRGISQPKMLTEMPTTASELFRVFSEIFDQLCSIYTHNIYFSHTLDNTRSYTHSISGNLMFKSYGLFCPLFRGVITDRVTRACFYFLTISSSFPLSFLVLFQV